MSKSLQHKKDQFFNYSRAIIFSLMTVFAVVQLSSFLLPSTTHQSLEIVMTEHSNESESNEAQEEFLGEIHQSDMQPPIAKSMASIFTKSFDYITFFSPSDTPPPEV